MPAFHRGRASRPLRCGVHSAPVQAGCASSRVSGDALVEAGMRARQALLGIGAALAALVVTPALADTRVALVIGNADYDNVRDLSNPINDARGMRSALERVGFSVIYGENLGKRDMERTV